MHLPVPRLIRRPEHVLQISVHELANVARRLLYRTVTFASKRNAIAAVCSADARPPIYSDGDAVLRLEVSAVMSWRTDEAAELIERRLDIKPRSRLIDTLSKSRHPTHTVS
jgi:hypothetical protein